MDIDIRAKSLEKAVKILKEWHNMTYRTYYRLNDTDIYRFIDCVELEQEQKDINYVKANKKFLISNN